MNTISISQINRARFLTFSIAITLFLSPLAIFAQSAPMKVVVTNFEGKSISGEKILFQGQTNKTKRSGVSDNEGNFQIDLPAGDVYDIKIVSIGDAKEYSTIEIPSLGEGEKFNEMVLTVMIEEASSFTLSNLHFATGSAKIKESSYSELNQLVEYLENKPAIKIEIGGHTDDEGSEESNKKLSQARADAVKSFLMTKGINSSRITSKGYGESSPVKSNETAQGKAMNRRTEITIL